MAKPKVDWERVEALYRAGMLSIREIAKQAGCTDKAIRNHAKAKGWTRDLTGKVNTAVRAALVRSEWRGTDPRTDEQVMEETVATTVAVVRGHRSRILRLWMICDALETAVLDSLTKADDFAPAIKQAIEEGLIDGDVWMRFRQVMSKEENAKTLLTLSTAVKNVIALERQAFGIVDGQDDGKETYEDRLEQLGGPPLPGEATPAPAAS